MTQGIEQVDGVEPPRNQTVDSVEDDICADGEHCCCCGPGDACCDCGDIMPDREEVPALRRALTDLLAACMAADAKEDLSPEIDGALLDAASEALELQFPIIWTAEQVAMLEKRQAEPMAHPYTCGNRSKDERSAALHRAQADEDGDGEPGLLIPTRRGWLCPACDYRQFWSHETGGPAALATTEASRTGSEARLREAAQRVLAGLNARIDAADEKAVPVFDGIADLHATLTQDPQP